MDLTKSKSLSLSQRSVWKSTTDIDTTSSAKSLSKESTWRHMSERSASRARLDSSSSKSSDDEGNTYRQTLDAILSPSRLAGLDAADVAPIFYNPYSFFSHIVSIRGRNFSMLVAPLLILLCWSLGWQLLFVYISEGNQVQDLLASIDQLVMPILTPLSFLLTFRLGRAGVRFWDARSAVGAMIATCRTNISIVSVAIASPIRMRKRQVKVSRSEKKQQLECTDDQSGNNECFDVGNQDNELAMKLLCEYARWLAVFPIAVKHHIRPTTRKGWEQDATDNKQRYELGMLLSNEDAQRVITATGDKNGKPLVVLNQLHQLAYDIAYCTYDSDTLVPFSPAAANRAMLYQQVTNQLNDLTLAYGAMERIKSTPLPFAYAIHLRTFLLIYLFLWNMISVAEYGWISIPFQFLLNWALLGVEAAAVECERPFEYRENHLTLGKVSVLISRNIGQTLTELFGE